MSFELIHRQITWLKAQINCLRNDIEDIDQNNTVPEYTVGGVNIASISEAMNTVGNLTVTEIQNYIIKHTYAKFKGEEGKLSSYELIYRSFLFKPGKGQYGVNSGVQTVDDDYFLLKQTSSESINIIPGQDPVVVTIVTLDIETSPDILVNTSRDTYVINAGEDYYFVMQSLQKTFPSPNKTYRYVGDPGTFGLGGTTTQPEDFILVSETGGVSFEVNDQDNFSRNIEVTSTDLEGAVEVTLEGQLASFINTLSYDKLDTDSEIWVDYQYIEVPSIDYILEVRTLVGGAIQVFIPTADNLTSVGFTVELENGGQSGTTLAAGNSFGIFGASVGEDLIFTNVVVNLQTGSPISVNTFTLTIPTEGNTSSQTLVSIAGGASVYTEDKKYRIINTGKGILNIAATDLQEVCCDDLDNSFAKYYNKKNELTSIPLGGKILVQIEEAEPEKLDVDLFASAEEAQNILDVANGSIEDRSWFERIGMDALGSTGSISHTSESRTINLSGVLYQVCRVDPNGSHVGLDGNPALRKSTDQGITWTPFINVFEDPLFDCRNIVFDEINGKLFVFFRKSDPNTNATDSVGYVTSDDLGDTWSSYTTISLNISTEVSYVFYGKIFTDGINHYVSAYSTINNRCEWVRSTDDGLNWASFREIYQDTDGDGELVEPYFDFVNGNVIGLIRYEGGDKKCVYYYSSDLGLTFTLHDSGLNNNKYLGTGPSFTVIGDKLYTAPCTRRDPFDYDKVLFYAIETINLNSSPPSFIKITEQTVKYQSDLGLYGYSDIVDLGSNRLLVSYVERSPTNPDINTQTSRFIEKAYVYQMYVYTQINNRLLVTPPLKENLFLIKNIYGITESRNFLNPLLTYIDEDGEFLLPENPSILLRKPENGRSFLKLVDELFKQSFEIDENFNIDTLGNLILDLRSGNANARKIAINSYDVNSVVNGFLEFTSNTGSFNQMSPFIKGKSSFVNAAGLLMQGTPFSDSTTQIALQYRSTRQSGSGTAFGIPFAWYNWTLLLMYFEATTNHLILERNALMKEGVSGNAQATVDRPTGIKSGTMTFDTTLGKPIWWDGSVWVDATGLTV